MLRLIGIALVLTLAVMPTLAWGQAQDKSPAFYPWGLDTIHIPDVTTSITPPAGQGRTPPTPSIGAAVAVPNFISYRDRPRTTSSESDDPVELADDHDPEDVLSNGIPR